MHDLHDDDVRHVAMHGCPGHVTPHACPLPPPIALYPSWLLGALNVEISWAIAGWRNLT